MARQPLTKRVGRVLREMRIERGISVVDLAAQLDRAKGSVSKLETGNIGIRLEVLEDICNLLQITPGEVMLRADRLAEGDE